MPAGEASLERNQIFNQGSFLWGEGAGKAIWRVLRTSEKILATPLVPIK